MKFKTAYIPLLGIILFFIGYVWAASLYPGGSKFILQAEGFHWFHNYWCDLLMPTAYNGAPNEAYSFAMVTLIELCVAMAILFYQFPKYFPFNPIWDRIISVGGILAVILVPLIATDFHHVGVAGGSFLGLIAILGIFKSLQKHQMRTYLFWGVLAIFLLVINNVMYFAKIGVYYLAFLQKIAFFFVLAWFGFISWGMGEKSLLKAEN